MFELRRKAATFGPSIFNPWRRCLLAC